MTVCQDKLTLNLSSHLKLKKSFHFNLATLTFDLWPCPSNSYGIWSSLSHTPNFVFLPGTLQLWEHSLTDRHTHRMDRFYTLDRWRGREKLCFSAAPWLQINLGQLLLKQHWGPFTLCTHENLFPNFFHNKPAFHDWHTIYRWCWWEHCEMCETFDQDCIIDMLWKAGLLLKNDWKYPAV